MSGLSPLPPDLESRFSWIDRAPVRRVIAALEAAEVNSSRFVGGCVRDSLLGFAPKDIDIATALTPDRVIAALKAAHLGAAPTGIDHGTITAIADHYGVEVTTLRADLTTDGRRATVAFTRDWAIDARRRDFTVNAIYLTPSHDLFDPVGGVTDLAERRVRFIGKAEDRIREDFLRILRFFRFSSRFALSFDDIGLAACASLKDGIRQLSAERVGDEFMKLLSLPAPQAAISAMQASGVMGEIWATRPQIEILARMKAIAPDGAAPLALAALYGEDGEGIDARLRLSNADGVRRRHAVANAEFIYPALDDACARALLYKMGISHWRDACLLAEARALAASDAPNSRDGAIANLAGLPERWTPPALPFGGKEALSAGVPEGPFVAKVIKAAEARWIAEGFPPRERAMAIFAEVAARVTSKD